MKPSFVRLVLAGFALTALVSLTNVACSHPTEVDEGTSEMIGVGHGHYGAYGGAGGYSAYGGHSPYGYGFGVDLADDATP